MDKGEYIITLIIIIIFDLIVFSPIIEYSVELGLNIEMTIGGVTAPTKDFFDPIELIFYKLMWHIIDIVGWYSTIILVLKLFKK